jgi:hypothetical protein
LQVESAVGLSLDRISHFLGARVQRMGVREIVGIFVAELGGLIARD